MRLYSLCVVISSVSSRCASWRGEGRVREPERVHQNCTAPAVQPSEERGMCPYPYKASAISPRYVYKRKGWLFVLIFLSPRSLSSRTRDASLSCFASPPPAPAFKLLRATACFRIWNPLLTTPHSNFSAGLSDPFPSLSFLHSQHSGSDPVAGERSTRRLQTRTGGRGSVCPEPGDPFLPIFPFDPSAETPEPLARRLIALRLRIESRLGPWRHGTLAWKDRSRGRHWTTQRPLLCSSRHLVTIRNAVGRETLTKSSTTRRERLRTTKRTMID